MQLCALILEESWYQYVVKAEDLCEVWISHDMSELEISLEKDVRLRTKQSVSWTMWETYLNLHSSNFGSSSIASCSDKPPDLLRSLVYMVDSFGVCGNYAICFLNAGIALLPSFSGTVSIDVEAGGSCACKACPTIPTTTKGAAVEDKNVITLELQRQKVKSFQNISGGKSLRKLINDPSLVLPRMKPPVADGSAVGMLTEYATGSDVDQVRILLSNFGIDDLE
ncbi:Light-harvesting complex-like protein OHP2, chloroplastic [Sesamum angolense]|uniref:Light-harvesting complex-like protein OHP2, chloroplastic n=1 Tax=Sesamum angolense TaxID=2727404 RepID=A0AAE1WCY0_9LAMI|nr:Light-harvesting complex-like protein OHP2, chloroplastic [Sesamum angolense]